MKINKELLEDFNINHMDKVGNVYRYGDVYLRVINKNYEKQVRQMFSCGLVSELESKHLIPKSRISEYHLTDNDMVIEHETVQGLQGSIYFSFEMMKTVANMILELDMTVHRYGYELKDCHYANVVLSGCTPVFVDLGSIVKKVNRKNVSWYIRDFFLQHYYYPLLMWEKGHFQMGSIFANSSYFSLSELRYLYYRYIPKGILDLYETHRDSLDKLRNMTNGNDAVTMELERMRSRINSLQHTDNTKWGTYQDKYWDNQNDQTRFSRIIPQIKELKGVNSAIELGANQGYFSWLLIRNTQISNILCSDYDQLAVDRMFLRFRCDEEVKDKITPFVMNFIMMNNDQLNYMKKDLVIANALTHHLLLGQKMNIHNMMYRFSMLTTRYALVEFMPLGLWDGKSKRKPNIPKWYTLDWFVEAFEKHFHVLKIEKLEKNRIAILGEKLNVYEEAGL